MSHRVKSAKRGSNRNSLRKLDLSLDHDAFGYGNDGQSMLNNGFRPHGGYRAFKSPRLGTSSHPPSQHSFDKSTDYQRQLQEDLENLLGDGGQQRTMSPTWAIKLSRVPNHSGESQLLTNKVLNTGKPYEDPTNHMRPRSRPSSSKSYYRPNSTHQYLTTTELKDASRKDCKDVKLGRPTRTTLLRARQRCNSAPVNSYSRRRDAMLASEQAEGRRAYTNNAASTIQNILGLKEGESVHSFLIGARYNRAHCLDTRSYEKYGVYMPRNNPLGCFVKNEQKFSNLGSDGMPGSPNDSPASPDSEPDIPHSRIPPPSPEPPPSSPLLPPTASREAWGDEEKKEVPIMEQLLNLDDGLNVKGHGMSQPNSSRPRSSRPPTATDRHAPSPRKPPNNTPRVLPTVSIQGTTMGLRNKDHKEPVPEDIPQEQSVLEPESCDHGNETVNNPGNEAQSDVIVNVDSESGDGRGINHEVHKEEISEDNEGRDLGQVDKVNVNTNQGHYECGEVEEESGGDDVKKGRVRFADEIVTHSVNEGGGQDQGQGEVQGHGENSDVQSNKDKVFLTEDKEGENIQQQKPTSETMDEEVQGQHENQSEVTEVKSDQATANDVSSAPETEVADSTVPITVNICRLQLNAR